MAALNTQVRRERFTEMIAIYHLDKEVVERKFKCRILELKNF